MQANTSNMSEIVVSVFGDATGVELGGSACQGVPSGDSYSAEICLSGDWQGVLQVQISQNLAREVAGTMLHRQHQWLDETSVMDAVGELANMIAGNLRPLVDGARRLSVPVVRYHRQEAEGGVEPLLGCAYSRGGKSVDVRLIDGIQGGRSCTKPAISSSAARVGTSPTS